MKYPILTGKYWDWASENKNCVKACEICDPTRLVWASSEHFWRFYGHFIVLAYSRNSADRRKITKMTIESWKMVGFHLKKRRINYNSSLIEWAMLFHKTIITSALSPRPCYTRESNRRSKNKLTAKLQHANLHREIFAGRLRSTPIWNSFSELKIAASRSLRTLF